MAEGMIGLTEVIAEIRGHQCLNREIVLHLSHYFDGVSFAEMGVLERRIRVVQRRCCRAFKNERMA